MYYYGYLIKPGDTLDNAEVIDLLTLTPAEAAEAEVTIMTTYEPIKSEKRKFASGKYCL